MAPKLTTSERLVEAARKAGCPRDQVNNFAQGFYVSFPWSLEFHAAARAADLPEGPDEIGVGGSRGPGKSHSIFAQLALDDCQRRSGLKCLYIRKVGKQVREQIDDLRRKVLAGIEHKYNRNEGTIVFPNNSRIITGHFRNESDIDRYLGLEYDIIAIEETTTLTSTKYQALRDSNRTSRGDWRPRMYNSTNPGGVGHAWYKARFIVPFRNGTETFTKFIPATIDDNPLVDVDYKRKLEENTGWRLRAYRYGDWDIAAGAFFTTFRYDIHVKEPFNIPPHWRVWCSMDYGFHHWLVVHLFAEDEDGNLYTIDEHAARRTQIPQHAVGIKKMLYRWGISLNRLDTFVAGHDVFAKRDAGPTIAQKFKMKGNDIRLYPANQDRVNGWAEMLDRLGDVEVDMPARWFIFKNCQRLIETLPYLEHNPRNPADVLKVDVDDDGNGGDDAADCARYGVMAAEKPKLQSGRVDWYARSPANTQEPEEIGRSDDEIEQLLSNL